MIVLFFCSSISSAYFETMNDAEVVPVGSLRVIASPQVVLTRHDGFTMNALTDFGFTPESDIRFAFGAGSVDFTFAGFYKWAPIPDVDNQPAMALMGGVSYANIDGSNEFSVQVHPIISKKFLLASSGSFTPHLALPVALMSRSGNAKLPIQVNFGTQWVPPNWKWKNSFLIAEAAVNISESFSAISIGAAFQFDQIIRIESNR